MNPRVDIRALRRDDLPFADTVRSLAGWNQTLEDWHRFLAMEPKGCFLAEWDGQPAGTATTITYGSSVAWIGMVLVHPDRRRLGVGTALLLRCIDYLRERGVSSIKLDATPAGKQVYDGLGFQVEWPLARWDCKAPLPRLASARPEIRAWRPSDAARVDALDRAAFGASRMRLLQALAPQSLHALVFEASAGSVEGYGFMRKGTRADYLGPIAAASAEAGLALVEALLAQCHAESVFWDIPDANVPAVQWARQHGFVMQRPLIRMFLGTNSAPSDAQMQFALAGPEVG